jgi:hypothetical protein
MRLAMLVLANPVESTLPSFQQIEPAMRLLRVTVLPA